MAGLERVLDFDVSDGSGDDEYNFTGGPELFGVQPTQEQIHASQGPYSAGLPPFNTPPYSDKAFSQHEFSYDDVSSIPLPLIDPPYRDNNSNFHSSNSAPLYSPNSTVWQSDPYSTAELSDVLGDLKINESGVGTYDPIIIERFTPYIDAHRA